MQSFDYFIGRRNYCDEKLRFCDYTLSAAGILIDLGWYL